jgi:hypothetical protein
LHTLVALPPLVVVVAIGLVVTATLAVVTVVAIRPTLSISFPRSVSVVVWKEGGIGIRVHPEGGANKQPCARHVMT